jgi:hypothetical protein
MGEREPASAARPDAGAGSPVPLDTAGGRAQGHHDRLVFDMLANVYSSIQEQVRFADTKAGVVAAFNAILVGFVASNIGTVNGVYGLTHDVRVCVVLTAALCATGLLTAVSIGHLIWAVRPRSGETTRRSKIFFGHIARDYQLDGSRYARDARTMTQDDWADDYGRQIVVVATIASKKHAHLRTSMTCTFWAISALLTVSLIVHAISIFASH